MNTQNDKIISAVQSARDDPNNALVRVEIRGFDEDGLLAYYVKIKEFNIKPEHPEQPERSGKK